MLPKLNLFGLIDRPSKICKLRNLLLGQKKKKSRIYFILKSIRTPNYMITYLNHGTQNIQ